MYRQVVWYELCYHLSLVPAVKNRKKPWDSGDNSGIRSRVKQLEAFCIVKEKTENRKFATLGKSFTVYPILVEEIHEGKMTSNSDKKVWGGTICALNPISIGFSKKNAETR